MDRFHFMNIVRGEYAVCGKTDIGMTTVLGSCVAACVWDPIAKIGGMNHFLLPGATENADANLSHGAFAMEQLINELLRCGAGRSQLRAKLFGGANVIDSSYGIGNANAQFAQSYLLSAGIPIDSTSLGGDRARRVRFAPRDGAVKIMFVPFAEIDPAEAALHGTAAPKNAKSF